MAADKEEKRLQRDIRRDPGIPRSHTPLAVSSTITDRGSIGSLIKPLNRCNLTTPQILSQSRKTRQVSPRNLFQLKMAQQISSCYERHHPAKPNTKCEFIRDNAAC